MYFMNFENNLINECTCKYCGIPFKIKSINANNNFILSCPNHLHNNFQKELSPKKYEEIFYKLNCKCLQCNKYRNHPNEIFYYCFKCRQIICNQCISVHLNQHPNFMNVIVNYNEMQNKCLNHINHKYLIFCYNCNDFLCDNCLNDYQEHNVNHQVDLISNLNNKNQIAIQNLKNEKENYFMLLENVKENIEIIDYLVNNVDRVYDLICQKENYSSILFRNNNNRNNDINYNYLNNNQNNNNENDFTQCFMNNLINNQNNNNKFNQNNMNYLSNNQNNNNQNNYNNNQNNNNNINMNYLSNNQKCNDVNNFDQNNMNFLSNNQNNINYFSSNQCYNNDQDYNNNQKNNNNNNQIFLNNNQFNIITNNAKYLSIEEEQMNNNNQYIMNNNNNNNIINQNNMNQNNINNNQIYNYNDKIQNNNANSNNNQISSLNNNILPFQQNTNEFIINAVYFDNTIFTNPGEVISSYQIFQESINGSLIFISDKTSFELFVKHAIKKIIETNQKYKFILIVNGYIASNIMPLINNNNEILSLFSCAVLYISQKGKYKNLMDQYKNFIIKDFDDGIEISDFLKQQKYNNIYKNNTEYPIEGLINYDLYKLKYFVLHQIMSFSYGDVSTNSYNIAIENLMNAFENIPYDQKLKNKKFFEVFNNIKNKNYESVIKEYIKKGTLYNYINKWAKSLNSKIYHNSSFFLGNLIYCLYKYGQNLDKGVSENIDLYAGFKMNVIEVMNLLSSQSSLITLPYFVFCSEEIKKADIARGSKLTKEQRFNSGEYSVLFKLEYYYKKNFDSNIFRINNLLSELGLDGNEDYLILPFTFYKLESVKLNTDDMTVNVNATIVGRKDEAERKIKNGGKLTYDTQNKYMK